MKKGVVMSIDKRWAYVFTEGCGLEKISLQPNMAVGQEVILPSEQPESTPVLRSFKPAWAAAGFLLILVLVLSLLVGTGTFLSPVYATLSIDVNPSIEMDLNRSLAVINVRAMNQDAALLLSGQDFTGMNWEEAIMHWTEVVDVHDPIQQRTVLVSAVLPEGAEQLRIRLLALEEKLQQGTLEQAQIRVVYTHDAGVSKIAQKNGLSVGRQMLLNQSQAKEQRWNAETIESASLGELVRSLLSGEGHDQTGLTLARNAQTLAETIRQGDSSASGMTKQETKESSQSPTASQSTSRETHRETNRETTGTLAPEQTGTQMTTRETSRETQMSQQTDPSGSTMNSQTSETNGATQEPDPSGSTATQQTGQGQG